MILNSLYTCYLWYRVLPLPKITFMSERKIQLVPCPACDGPNDTANGHYCRPCRAAYGRARRYLKIDKAYTRQTSQEFLKAHRKKCIEYKGGCCERCGWTPVDSRGWCVLHLHHPLRDREWTLASSATRVWEVVKAELDRCELLCANCHIIEHHEDRSTWSSGRPRKPMDAITEKFIEKLRKGETLTAK